MASLERFWATVLTYITNVGRGEIIEIQRCPPYFVLVLMTVSVGLMTVAANS